MDNNQLKRLNKLDSESFFLLKVEKDEVNYTLSISGSTKNIYKVKILGNSRTIYCDCPDSKGWCRNLDCYCKHSCFVLFRIFKTIFTNKEDIFREKFLTVEQYESISNRLDSMLNGGLINYQNSDIVDEELLEKFKKLEQNEFKSEKNEDYEVNEEQDKKTDMCPICFIDIEENDKLIKCPKCKNISHLECMEKWLSVGNLTCVYCRSDVWKDYGINKSENGNYNCLE